MITKRENDENPEQRFTKIISNTGLNNGKTLLNWKKIEIICIMFPEIKLYLVRSKCNAICHCLEHFPLDKYNFPHLVIVNLTT